MAKEKSHNEREKKGRMSSADELILVDLDDQEIGRGEKMDVHQKGLLHRAFSVFLFDGDRLLMQRRAAGKYHSALLWANTCCSHPRAGELLLDAAMGRLKLECGIENAVLSEAGRFVYRAPFSNGLVEYEVDHVFVGEYAGPFAANPEEASEMRFVPLEELKEDMLRAPEHYAAWFFTALGIAEEYRKAHRGSPSISSCISPGI